MKIDNIFTRKMNKKHNWKNGEKINEKVLKYAKNPKKKTSKWATNIAKTKSIEKYS